MTVKFKMVGGYVVCNLCSKSIPIGEDYYVSPPMTYCEDCDPEEQRDCEPEIIVKQWVSLAAD